MTSEQDISGREALGRLKEGNRRFVQNRLERCSDAPEVRRRELAAGQAPFAVIIGCSDSRVPVEMVFDQGLGDLFVIRVAGNIATPPQIGSVEFAAHLLGTRLVVVLGHSGCGAVQAAIDEIRSGEQTESPNLGSIVDWIRPSVEASNSEQPSLSRDDLVRRVVRENARASASHLRSKSEILEQRIREEHLLVVEAVYDLESGVVDFI